jgi:DNA modification methylase
MDGLLQIKRVPLDALHVDPANARAHGERNLEAIVSSLQRFGQAEPLVVHGPTGRVIGGNGRLVAMRKLGWTECDVVELEVDPIEATALGIALNRTAELAEWDNQALARLLDQLRAEDALGGVGFEQDEVDALLRDLTLEEPGEVEDPGPEEPPEEPVSRTGDLWLLGAHRLLCGDSTRPEDVERLLAGERGALFATDPPYCVDYTGADRPNGSGKDWSHVYREVDIRDLGEFLDLIFRAWLPQLEPKTAIYVWHAHLQQPVIAELFERHGLLLHQVLVWAKPTAVFGHSYYHWRHEPCAFGWRKGEKPPHGPGVLSSVWEEDWEGKQRVVGNSHPTQKPTRLFEIPMEQHTRPGAVVLEPFSGSGSQIIAGERLGRRVRAMEIAPAFVDVAIQRFEKATGKEAHLEGEGASFAEVAEKRGSS